MRPSRPVLERIQDNLNVVISPENKDEHWIWQGKLAPRQNKQRLHRRGFSFRDDHQNPPRIRDTDGKLRSVSRILHREMFGMEYPYTLKRSMGCDYTCVNPYHMTQPKQEFEVQETDEIQELVNELREYVAAYGRNDDKIIERYGLDYTEEEIKQALIRIDL